MNLKTISVNLGTGFHWLCPSEHKINGGKVLTIPVKKATKKSPEFERSCGRSTLIF